jgi:hypothetical protein
MQERARRGQDIDVVARSYDIELIQRSHRRFGLAFGVTKGGEIVLSDEPLRGRMHRIGVEGPRQPPGMADVDREIGAGVFDPVAIVALFCGEARLEIIRHDVR